MRRPSGCTVVWARTSNRCVADGSMVAPESAGTECAFGVGRSGIWNTKRRPAPSADGITLFRTYAD